MPEREASRRRRRRRLSGKKPSPRWPPRQGDTVYFQTDEEGVKSGILKGVRQGLVWVDYIMEDGRIVPEHDVVMCPNPGAWRDPDTVTEEERRRWVESMASRVKSGPDLRKNQAVWSDFVHYGAHILLRLEKEGKVEPPSDPLSSPRIN
jgi:hypothetical protein